MKKFLLTVLAALVVGCPSTKVTSYGNDVCIVSGNKLGSMGIPVSVIYEGKRVGFCCRPCIKKFNKNPEKYLK